MLAAFRSFAKSPWAIGLIAALIAGFALFGISDVFQPRLGGDIVKAGSRTVSAVQFRAEFERYRKGLEERYRQPISLEVVLQQNLDRGFLKDLALQESLSELMTRAGLRAPDKLFREQLRRNPAFFDPITGKFDQQRYLQVLNDNGLTWEIYERSMIDKLRTDQFVSAAAAGLRAPRAYTALTGAFVLEQRDLAFFMIDPRSVGTVAPPTDAELQAFLKENAAQLTLPEFRGMTVVRISRKAYESGVTVNPADVQTQFDFQKDSLSRPELRSALQIPVKDAAQANAVIAAIKAGESPNVAAGKLGVQPVRYDDKPRTAFFDPTIAAAAFSLPVNGVSAPLKGQFGLAVVVVTKITPGAAASLDQHRAAIEAKLRTDLAAQKVSDIAKVYEDAHAAGSDMVEAARKAGLATVTIPPVTADGRAQTGQPTGLPEPLLKAAFELSQGGESDILDAGDGEYFIVRVDRVIPPALPPFAEAKPSLTRALMLRRMAERMQAKADALAERVRKGESLDAVAASAGAKVERITGLDRARARQDEALTKRLGQQLLGGAFTAKKGEAFTARGQQFGFMVAVVTAIRPADVQQVARVADAQRAQFTEELFRDIATSTREYAQTTLKTQTNLKAARIAIGVDPAQAEDAPAAKDAPAGKGQ